MENNIMLTLGEIIDNCFGAGNNVYIPLIQRNYKWDKETAKKLATDLWKAYKEKQTTYTIGMITFYKESEIKLQLIDGQQRIITLFMILRYLEPEKDFFLFEFERDEGILEEKQKRINYLKDVPNCERWEETYADVERFKENYCAIEEGLKVQEYEESQKDGFIEYIKNNLYFLLRIAETEPFDEFMNLNKNKTRFVVSDRIKASLMIDSAKHGVRKEDILNLFQNLSKELFSNNEVWKLISQGYYEEEIPKENSERFKDKLYPDENRLKLLCCERYGSNEFDVSGTQNYEFEKEWKVLNDYKSILQTLEEDITNHNWNSYNAIQCLYQLKNKNERFFNLLKNSDGDILEKYLITEVDNLDGFSKSCFIESQLANDKMELDYINENKTIESEFNEKKKSEWYDSGNEKFEAFKEIYNMYIQEKYQRMGK